jgi:flagellar hook-basal body protein
MAQIHTGVFNTLSAVDQWMKVIAGNVTGTNVTGFRGTQVEFGTVLEQMTRSGARPTDGYGSVNPIQRTDSGVTITGTKTDFSQGSITNTGNQTDVAISGDAMFVLSRVPVPRTMDDIVFTRDGSFTFEEFPGPVDGTGTYRLVNKDGFFVMGWNTAVDPTNNARPFGTPPEESTGTGLEAFGTVVGNGAGAPPLPVQMQNIQLDMVRNPDAANNVTFDERGMLLLNGDAPRDLANNPANMHLTLTKFANNQGLVRQGGGAYFQYDIVAGQMFTGTAANSNNGTVVGRSNQIVARSIENSNTSINTVMPELTLAQKSFSAASKIISVGNTMIDDVNQLIR